MFLAGGPSCLPSAGSLEDPRACGSVQSSCDLTRKPVSPSCTCSGMPPTSPPMKAAPSRAPRRRSGRNPRASTSGSHLGLRLEGVHLDRPHVVAVVEDLDVLVAVGVLHRRVEELPDRRVVGRHRPDQRELDLRHLLVTSGSVDHPDRVLPRVEARHLAHQRAVHVMPNWSHTKAASSGRQRHVLRRQRVDRRRQQCGRAPAPGTPRARTGRGLRRDRLPPPASTCPRASGDGKVHICPPAIDPLSPKNMALSPEDAAFVCDQFGIDVDRPLMCQVSRFDPWKDPIGRDRRLPPGHARRCPRCSSRWSARWPPTTPRAGSSSTRRWPTPTATRTSTSSTTSTTSGRSRSTPSSRRPTW